MTKNTKRYFIFIFMVVFVSFIYGTVGKGQNYGERNPDVLLEQKQDFSIQLSEGFYDEYFLNAKNITLQQMKNRADIIVTASVSDEREMGQYSTNTKVIIDKVWQSKDGTVKEGNKIWIEEPATISWEHSFCTDGYQIMKKNRKYLLFLMHLPCIEGYRYNKREARTYTVVSEYYGKYCVTGEEKISLYGDVGEEGLEYKDVADYAIFSEKEEVIKRYVAFADEVKKYITKGKNK